MLSLLFVILIPTPSNISFCCIFYVPGGRLRTLETVVGTLVSVSVAVLDDRTIPRSVRTTPGHLSVCHTPRSVPAPTLSNRDEISFAWADASSDKSWAIVSVSEATVDLSAAVAVTRLARASTVSAC